MLVLRWYWIGDVLLACGPGLEPPSEAVFLGVSALNHPETAIAADIDGVQREALDLS